MPRLPIVAPTGGTALSLSLGLRKYRRNSSTDAANASAATGIDMDAPFKAGMIDSESSGDSSVQKNAAYWYVCEDRM